MKLLPLKSFFMCLIVSIFFIITTSLSLSATTVEDVENDTFGTNALIIDIISMAVEFDSQNIYFGATFTSPVFETDTGNPSDLFGYIDIDVDQDSSTGTTALSDYYNGSSEIGMDYYLEFMPDGNPGFIALKDSNAKLIDNVSIIFNDNSFLVTIPRNMINNDDGYVDYTAFFGDNGGPDDVIPNQGFATNKTTDPGGGGGGGCFINTVTQNSNHTSVPIIFLLSGIFLFACILIVKKSL